jgi:hypothetical protein
MAERPCGRRTCGAEPQPLPVRDRLVQRGLVVVEEAASGRGRASTVALPFVTQGPWWEGEINAELFEAVLSRSQARGPARLVLGAMAGLADEAGIVRGLSGVELCVAAGVDDRTHRRARKDLLKSGELILVHRACGRGNTNVWEVRPPGGIAPVAGAGRPPRRLAPPVGAARRHRRVGCGRNRRWWWRAAAFSRAG